MKIAITMKSTSAASPLTALKREAAKMEKAAARAKSLIAAAETMEAAGKDISKKVEQIKNALGTSAAPAKTPVRTPAPKIPTAEQRRNSQEARQKSADTERKALNALRKKLVAGGVPTKQISVIRYGLMGMSQDLVAYDDPGALKRRAKGLVVRAQADGSYVVADCMGPGGTPEFIGKTTKVATLDALIARLIKFTAPSAKR